MPAIQYGLAKALKAEGQTQRAVEAAKRCVQLDQKFADGHYLLGQLYRESQRPELARQEFELFRQLKDGTKIQR